MAALYQLANDINVRVNDDRPTGPGWKWLETAYEAILEAALWAREHDEDVWDATYEQTLEVIPVYTYTLWETFVALSGWQVESRLLSVDLSSGEDLSRVAECALQTIAERIAYHVVENLDAIIEARQVTA